MGSSLYIWLQAAIRDMMLRKVVARRFTRYTRNGTSAWRWKYILNGARSLALLRCRELQEHPRNTLGPLPKRRLFWSTLA